MKLERNIREFPPLARRLDRRFALPRALAIFHRLSTRLGLSRVWPDLPYMNFVRAWSARPADAGETRTVAAHTGREAVVLQHSSFHTHVALSPVVTKLIREQYTLPVRELRFDRQTRLQLERVTSNSPANDTGSSRLVIEQQVLGVADQAACRPQNCVTEHHASSHIIGAPPFWLELRQPEPTRIGSDMSLGT